MKFTGTVNKTPRFDDEQHMEIQSKREYRKAQKGVRDLRRDKRKRWSEKD